MNRIEILQKLAAGEITTQEAERLLRGGSTPEPEPEPITAPPSEPEAVPHPAPEMAPHAESATPGVKPRWVNIHIDGGESKSRHTKINLRLPYGLINWGLKLGARFSEDQSVREALQTLQTEGAGTVLNIEADSGEKIMIVLE